MPKLLLPLRKSLCAAVEANHAFWTSQNERDLEYILQSGSCYEFRGFVLRTPDLHYLLAVLEFALTLRAMGTAQARAEIAAEEQDLRNRIASRRLATAQRDAERLSRRQSHLHERRAA